MGDEHSDDPAAAAAAAAAAAIEQARAAAVAESAARRARRERAEAMALAAKAQSAAVGWQVNAATTWYARAVAIAVAGYAVGSVLASLGRPGTLVFVVPVASPVVLILVDIYQGPLVDLAATNGGVTAGWASPCPAWSVRWLVWPPSRSWR